MSLPRFLPFNGAQGVVSCNGRQAREIVAHLLEKARGDEVAWMLCYSFVRPGVAANVVHAARRGVDVYLYLSADEVAGSSNALRATTTLLRIVGACEEHGVGPSGWGNRFALFRRRGSELQPARENFGRAAGLPPGSCGAQRAKVFYLYPVQMVGSSNWTCASEANYELTSILQVEDAGVSCVTWAMRDMAEGAIPVTFAEMQDYARPKRHLMGARSSGSSRTTGATR